jgi:hypothetical protein
VSCTGQILGGPSFEAATSSAPVVMLKAKSYVLGRSSAIAQQPAQNPASAAALAALRRSQAHVINPLSRRNSSSGNSVRDPVSRNDTIAVEPSPPATTGEPSTIAAGVGHRNAATEEDEASMAALETLRPVQQQLRTPEGQEAASMDAVQHISLPDSRPELEARVSGPPGPHVAAALIERSGSKPNSLSRPCTTPAVDSPDSRLLSDLYVDMSDSQSVTRNEAPSVDSLAMVAGAALSQSDRCTFDRHGVQQSVVLPQPLSQHSDQSPGCPRHIEEGLGSGGSSSAPALPKASPTLSP